MLPSLRLLSRIRREGYDAGYHGTPLEKCPYDTPSLKDAWLDGCRRGIEDRKLDMADSRHPEINYQKRRRFV